MKNLNQIRVLFGMCMMFCLMAYMTSCSKVEVEELPDSIVEASTNFQLPELAYHLQENTTGEAIPLNVAYENVGNIGASEMAKTTNVFQLNSNTSQSSCDFFDFYACEDSYSCSYCTYLSHYCYWTHYFTWFHNPTNENCKEMTEAYCNYLITFRNCYGGDPVTSEDCYGSSPCN